MAAYAAGPSRSSPPRLGAFAARRRLAVRSPTPLIGFRVECARHVSASSVPLHDRVTGLAVPASGSASCSSWRSSRSAWRASATAVWRSCCGAWLAAGVAGVLAGGSYWPHYLIQLVGAGVRPAAVGLARAPPAPASPPWAPSRP